MSAALPGDYWEQAGRSAAPALDGFASVLVVGDDTDAVARAAVGLGRAQARRRRVAVGDLIGEAPALQSLVSGDDPHGLVDSFLYGVSLNRVARRADDGGNFFVLPSGTESVIPEEVYTSPRWRRLASGFREVGALLLLAAPATAAGLDELAASMDGVVLVGRAEALTAGARERALATIPEPEAAAEAVVPEDGGAPLPFPERMPDDTLVDAPAAAELDSAPAAVAAVAVAVDEAPADVPREPPGEPIAEGPTDAGRGRRRRGRAIREPSTPWLIPALAGTAVVGVAFYLLHARDVPAKSPNAVAPRAVDSAPAAAAPAPRADSLADTLAASPLLAANPEDSARASAYAIELWRSTTYEGAVARVDRDWPTLPAVSITPMVTAAGDSVLWYKVSAGAYTDSNTAMSRRATLRARGGGTLDLPIVRAPYALRVVQGVQIDSLGRYGAELRARQLPAYALLQLDGRANIYLGAFETLQQANAYRRRLRSQGLMPPIVFRVGEPYAMPRKP